MEPISTSQVVAHGSIAIFWAIVHALNAHRKWTSKSFLDFIVLVIMSSFTWVMFTLLAFHFFPAATYLIYAMSGAWGYLGVEWMSFIVDIIKWKLKIWPQ